MLNVSGTSLGIMMCWDFQLFGYNMMLGQAIDSIYFEYLTLASIAVFFSVLVKMRLAFMSIRLQNANNPRIYERNMQNPVIMYSIKLLIFITVFYIASFYVMPYYFFNYYMIPFYLFGIPQILHSAKVGSRNCFKW